MTGNQETNRKEPSHSLHYKYTKNTKTWQIIKKKTRKKPRIHCTTPHSARTRAYFLEGGAATPPPPAGTGSSAIQLLNRVPIRIRGFSKVNARVIQQACGIDQRLRIATQLVKAICVRAFRTLERSGFANGIPRGAIKSHERLRILQKTKKT